MGEIVNLNKARKAKRKVEQKGQAQTNRILHGLPKAEKRKALAEVRKDEQALDGKKLEGKKPDQDQ